jgi:predicted DNA-binding transcriptional regulator AlpA
VSIEHIPTCIIPTSGGADDLPNDQEYWFALIDEKEAAGFLGLTDRTLQKYRQQGGGPKFVKLSDRCVRYRRIDCHEYIKARLRASTSDPGPDAAQA